ncbi:MAG: tyrosine-type recombinase/integrase, partial [Hyphomicrobiaceae bacterium]
MTIGTYGTWTPAAAREEAERLLRIADSGGDPVQGRQDERGAITFHSLAKDYLENAEKGLIVTRARRRKKPGTVTIDKYRMRHLIAHFGDKPVKDIHRSDCQRCLEKLIEGRHGATRTFGLLGAVLSYAVDRQHISLNPARGIATPADGRREFRLDADGYRALGQALEAAEARAEAWQAVAAIRLLALTGCRKGEILRLQRTEVDVANRCLRLRDTKTTTNETAPSVRPLSEAALDVLRAVLARPGRPESPY